MTRRIFRWLLGTLYLVAAWFHVTDPAPFLYIMPGWVPYPVLVVYWTGMAELAGAIALLQPFGPLLRRAAGVALALYALCVWPANINHFIMDMAKPDHGWGLAYHIPREMLQPVLIWLALWTGEVTDWPFRKRGKAAE